MIKILTGDCREVLRGLPDESVHCSVTSPPYFGLRDYGVDGQIGLEPTVDEFVAQVVAVFSEVKRVLRADGTLWLNLGDSYAGGGHGGGGSFEKERHWRNGSGRADGVVNDRGQRNRDGLGRFTGLKPKDMIGIPWRVAFALQADGWYLRQDIIWSKPNPMPESVRDRCTKAHEYIFMLSKGRRYFYDSDSIKEDGVMKPQNRFSDREGHPKGDSGRPLHRRPPGGTGQPKIRKTDSTNGSHQPCSSEHSGIHRAGTPREVAERNKRSVWEVATNPFPEAHFATFPPALIEPCILAGCPKGGIVLDPFGGAGTTGLVADRLGRDAILIELNPDYAAMAERRIKTDSPLFTEVVRI